LLITNTPPKKKKKKKKPKKKTTTHNIDVVQQVGLKKGARGPLREPEKRRGKVKSRGGEKSLHQISAGERRLGHK